MTDLATAAGAPTEENAIVDGTDATGSAESAGGDGAGDRPVEWAPAEDAPKKKRHIGRWIGIGLGVIALGLGAASTILIAPGTAIAGVQVGGMTAGAAAEAVSNHLNGMQVTLTGEGGGKQVTGSDLGVRVDATKLADKAFAERPMWNITSWMAAPISAPLTLDDRAADHALRAQVPTVYQDATDATVSFTGAGYTATPAKNGSGIDLKALTAAISDAAEKGRSTLSFRAEPATVAPAISDKDAAATVGELNTLLSTVGFYVGTERTVPIDAATASKWLTVAPVDGKLTIRADQAAIQKSVDALPALVNRAPVNATSIVDSSGSVLDDVTPGVAGRQLGDVSGAAAAFAAQLAGGKGNFALPVKDTPFASTTLLRKIDVNLSTETLTVTENGNVVDSWLISSGRGDFATHTGSFTVNWKLDSQNMGNTDLTKAPFYYQPDVKWVMYFNGDEALHGVYWHDNWGTPMSHGCVGMPEWRAEWLFDWSPQGTEVNVHY
ncbi:MULTISPECIES: L,D-transpeptidase family protein [unclassified Microbacterium]|uniref:L,D-transpeptidase family protein n=1 Tax=unclassified Microbacterium TaxID=2609290 RepID=UPI001AD264D2|nr:L,D-transpeptidase family protein [Microbacterium sp.]MBN9157808.1 L,D-transpeptidase/peptidoglycan binding protein [Microbacterium sp.]MBS1900841.1 L,D-transpeptidase/peptidoglycan binding protein [Actinomycetota bacterium]